MNKDLSQMTLEELWELFPISLVPHDDGWKQQFDEMNAYLTDILSEYRIVRISHIGSTAIQGIMAKNIVDILLEIASGEDIEKVAKALTDNGYIQMSASDSRISLNKGYTPDGYADQVYHVHVRYEGDNDEIYFRDYLNAHPDAAKEYERLKLSLWKRFEHDRDAYTAGKTEFVRRIMSMKN